MELWQLRTFKVLAKTLHFTRASEILEMTQPAVSHQIKSLERETGDSLFVRGRSKIISLTPHGELILKYANKLLSEVEEMKRAIVDSKPIEEGEVLVATDLRWVSGPFLETRKDFRSIYPNVEIYLKSAEDHDDLTRQVRSGECNLGVAGSRKNCEGIVAIPYGESKMVPVVGADHRLAKASPVRLAELAGEEWVLLSKNSNLRSNIDTMFSKENFYPTRIHESNDPAVIRELIQLGYGIGFLPSWSIESDLESGLLFALDIGVAVSVSLYILLAKIDNTPLTYSYVDFVLEKQISGVDLRDRAS